MAIEFFDGTCRCSHQKKTNIKKTNTKSVQQKHFFFFVCVSVADGMPSNLIDFSRIKWMKTL